MANEKVLIIGAGLLGSRLIAQAGPDFEVHAADTDTTLGEDAGCRFHVLDITNRKAVDELITGIKPAAVFNTAALTNVDRCELDPTLARKINGSAAGYIAIACAKASAYLCHISTDYVFDGKLGNYTEDAPTGPVCQYGISKLLGEGEVRCLGQKWRWTVCRSSILYGSYRKRFNFATWLVDEMRAKRPVRIVTDQTGSPTLADDLAGACLTLWKKDARGFFHLAGREPISRYDFALKVCDVFLLDKSLVIPIKTDELKQRATRPPNSSLNVSKGEKILCRRMLDVRDGLEAMKTQEPEIPVSPAVSSRTA